MKKRGLAKLLRSRRFLAGCGALTMALFVGVASFQNQVPELPQIIDPLLEVSIEAEAAPLAATPTTTKKTTTKKKTTKKTVKLKTASKKTQTKNLPTKTKETKKSKESGNTKVETTTKVVTAVKEAYKKGSKKKTVTTTVTTTTTVVTTKMPASTSSDKEGEKSDQGSTGSGGFSSGSTTPTPTPTPAASSGSTAQKKTLTDSEFRVFASKMPANVLNAYVSLGFKVIIDPSVSYSGYFDAKKRSITLKKQDESGDIYHELGHFIAFAAGNVDKSAAFGSAYGTEKSSFNGVNKTYANQNVAEYFAECMRVKIMGQTGIDNCTQTKAALEAAIAKITDSQVIWMKRVYGSVWAANS